MNENEERKPRLQWTKNDYGGNRLSLGNGLLSASVSWATTKDPKQPDKPWSITIQGSHKTQRFSSANAAMVAIENYFEKMLREMLTEFPADQ